MKLIILSITFSIPFFANTMVRIKQSQLSISERLGTLSLCKSEHGFTVLKDNNEQKVHAYNVDPVLRSLTTTQLVKVLQTSRIRINQLSNEDYKLSLQGELKGGGVMGANVGFWAGKFLTHLVAQVGIVTISGTVSIIFPPAGIALFGALESTLAIPVETASNVVGCATAIAGAVATGPV